MLDKSKNDDELIFILFCVCFFFCSCLYSKDGKILVGFMVLGILGL